MSNQPRITSAYGLLVLNGQDYRGRCMGDYVDLRGLTFVACNNGQFEELPINHLPAYVLRFGGIREQGETDLCDDEIFTIFTTTDGEHVFEAHSADAVYAFLTSN